MQGVLKIFIKKRCFEDGCNSIQRLKVELNIVISLSGVKESM